MAGHCGRSECREQIGPKVAWLPLGARDVGVAHEGEHVGAEVRVLVEAGVREVVQLRRQQRLQWSVEAPRSAAKRLPLPPFAPLLPTHRFSTLTYSHTTYLYGRILSRQRTVHDALDDLEVVPEGWVREGAARAFEGDDGKAPDVARVCVALSLDALGRHVRGGAAPG